MCVCVKTRFVSQEADCKKLVDTAVEKFGGLHVAFNNAGFFRPTPFADMNEETIDSLVGVLFKSLTWCFKHQVSHEECTAPNVSVFGELRVLRGYATS